MESTPQHPHSNQSDQPQQSTQPETPATPQVSPIAPINTWKATRSGWIAFSVGLAITLIGFLLNLISIISIIAFAFAARLGLQSKNKPLTILSFVFIGLVVALYIAATILS